MMVAMPMPPTQRGSPGHVAAVGAREFIDAGKLNEAFASVVLKIQKDLQIPDENLNVNGRAIAMGHPLGATGAMLVGAEMLTGRHGDRLGSWMAAVASEDLPHLHRFVPGIERDHAAVLKADPVLQLRRFESNVNRIKMLKRQMYGCAGFDLLRKRILLCH